MYSVRDELKKDPSATVRAIAAMGYQGLEFYAPYFAWSRAQAKDMKKLLDDLTMRCFSTHNDQSYLQKDKIQNAIGSSRVGDPLGLVLWRFPVQRRQQLSGARRRFNCLL